MASRSPFEDDACVRHDCFCSKTQQLRLKPFIAATKTNRKRRAGILAVVCLGGGRIGR